MSWACELRESEEDDDFESSCWDKSGGKQKLGRWQADSLTMLLLLTLNPGEEGSAPLPRYYRSQIKVSECVLNYQKVTQYPQTDTVPEEWNTNMHKLLVHIYKVDAQS